MTLLGYLVLVEPFPAMPEAIFPHVPKSSCTSSLRAWPRGWMPVAGCSLVVGSRNVNALRIQTPHIEVCRGFQVLGLLHG